jgi:hypothetical protein
MTDPRIDQIAEWLSIFVQPDQTTELRALGLARGTVSRIFRGTELGAMAMLAADLEEEGAKGVYFVLNPLRPSLNKAQAARDNDVIRRHWLPIDVDPIRTTNTIATENQRECAWRVLDRVRSTLQGAGFTAPIVGDSGNGWHLCYRIDWPNDDISRERIRRLLFGLNERCSDSLARVDTSTFNAARIWRLYGTLNRKGQHGPSSNGHHRNGNGSIFPLG